MTRDRNALNLVGVWIQQAAHGRTRLAVVLQQALNPRLKAIGVIRHRYAWLYDLARILLRSGCGLLNSVRSTRSPLALP